MKLRLVITEQAHADILRNAVWWALNHSAHEAETWQQTVYKQLPSILEMPESHPLSPENPSFPYELREKNVGSGRGGYRAIFTVQKDAAIILTVRSTSERALQPDDLVDDGTR